MGGAAQRSSGTSDRKTRARIVGILAAVIRLVGWLFALILVAHIALRLGNANPANGITTFVAYWADRLALGFHDLFRPPDVRVRVLVNYGLAALFWLVVGTVVARLVGRLG